MIIHPSSLEKFTTLGHTRKREEGQLEICYQDHISKIVILTVNCIVDTGKVIKSLKTFKYFAK